MAEAKQGDWVLQKFGVQRLKINICGRGRVEIRLRSGGSLIIAEPQSLNQPHREFCDVRAIL